MPISLALADAKKNGDRENARCRITLKSGIQYDGKINVNLGGTVNLYLDGDGWVTIDIDEIAAVESHR